MSRSTVQLRGHHLLCMLTYIGKGYTPDFVCNFDAVVQNLNEGADILVTQGPDIICSSLHDTQGPTCKSGEHCLQNSTSERDKLALKAVAGALNMPLKEGSVLSLNEQQYKKLRRLFFDKSLRQACKGCEWHDLCTAIADEGFQGIKLMPLVK